MGPSATLHPPAPIATGLLLAAWLVGCGGTGPSAESATALRFNRDVRPIFAAQCFACHGPDANKREADLRLDRSESAFADRGGRRAIVPGDPARSELVRRIHSDDPDVRMPPPSSKFSLSPEEIGVLTRWIEEGAEYQPHWSYVPLARPDPPTVQAETWVRNPIDRFVLAPLEERGLAPSEEADPVTLIRRLSFDLTGLPPTRAEVDALVRDPTSYEEQVDRLLASPQFGERMAMHWLDLVRYADTNGYNADQHRHIHPYRDYVIQSFNENLPFDQFTREQIAGDLLPNARTAQLVASGYNRLNMVTTEVGGQPEEYLAKYAADRVRTTASVWLGGTLGCAQCHDHKFDPYTMKDFYSFAAFFADLQEEGVYSTEKIALPPEIGVPGPREQRELRRIQTEARRLAARIQRRLAREGAEIDAGQPAWEAAIRRGRSQQRLTPVPASGWSAVAAGGRPDGKGRIVVSNDAQSIPTGVERALRAPSRDFELLLRLEDLEFTSKHDYVMWRVRDTGPEAPHLIVRLSHTRGDLVSLEAKLSEGDQLGTQSIGNAGDIGSLAIRVRWEQSKRLWHVFWGKNGGPSIRLKDTPLFDGAAGGGDADADADANANAEWTTLVLTNKRVGEGVFSFAMRLAWREPTPVVDDVPGRIALLLATPPAQRSPARAEAIRRYYRREAAPALAGERARFDELQVEMRLLEESLPQTLVSSSGEPRVTRILPRGNWMDASGDVVHPAVPEFLPPLPEGQPPDRLALAQWLVSPENPLTARVFVNRLWNLTFGRGLSRVLDDLGTQGTLPTHPELLDWLASEFVASGWDVKHMLRLLVTSATYRMSSRGRPELREFDPYNDLMARQARFRLDAEMVRDNALRISGLLNPEIGGASAKPYQPEDYWANIYTFLDRETPASDWRPDDGPAQYRRGLYTYWKRSFLHPSLMAFDAPSREECTAKRPRSNTPLQALVLLNDPSYVEAARVFAERIGSEGGAGIEDQVRWAYREALSREPEPRAIAILTRLYADHLDDYRADPEAAEELLGVGYHPRASGIEPARLAALTSVSRAILNLHEAIVRM